ncbi:MAG: PAS domain S-box protein, partial [Dehalococcoidia bacterium]
IVTKAAALAAELTADLHESEEILRTTLYSIGDAMISTNAEGLVVSMNPVAESLTGWSEQEAIGQPLATVFRIVNEHTGRPVESPAQKVLKEGRIVGLANHTLLLARDGREIPIADSGAPIRNVVDEITGVVLVFRDQTEELKVLQNLENSQQRLESMFRAVPVGIGMAAADNIITANDRLCEITGYTCEELIGQSIRMLYTSQEEFKRCGFGDGEQIERTGIDAIETVWQRKDGTHVDVLFSVSPVDRTEPTNGITFTARDITERKRAEADRAARQEAEQANHAKSAFLANMSHEIRTPLNAVLGFAQILERDTSLTPRQTGMLHTIVRSGQHLLDLINDILDMSKIEAGKLELSPVDFCIHDLLDDLEMMFQSRAHAKQLQLLMERDDRVPRYVHADEGKLRQVLINLMSNAVKFTTTGRVAVRVRGETAAGNSAEDANVFRLAVEVEDSGPGIPEDELENIFEPFRQSAGGRDAGGTGLGLAVSRRLVEMMGGSLTVKSEVGKGSCFRFDALVTPVEGSAHKAVAAMRQIVGLEPGTGPYRILVVDDQKDNRDLLRALLEPLDFEVREAVNGQEALDLFETWSPHAVLMDMRMPVLDGYEATRRIKATKKGRATPVIAVTASAFEDAEKEVWATGVDAYVRKPFRSEEIFAALA